MDTKFLQELGLTKNEAKIYVSLLENGKSLAGTIAEKARIHRRNTYDTLDRLSEKGLVSHITSNNKKYYEAVSPERLLEILKHKLDIGTKLLPELLSKYNSSKSKQEVMVLEGEGGMKTYLYDVLKENPKEFLLIGGAGLVTERLGHAGENIMQKVKDSKMKVKIIWSPEAKRKKIESILDVESKTFPKNYSIPVQFSTYKDKAAIYIWSTKPLIILIKSKEISQGFKQYFNFMWEICS